MAFMRSTVVVWVRRLCGHASWGLRVGPSIVAKKMFYGTFPFYANTQKQIQNIQLKIQIIGKCMLIEDQVIDFG